MNASIEFNWRYDHWWLLFASSVFAFRRQNIKNGQERANAISIDISFLFVRSVLCSLTSELRKQTAGIIMNSNIYKIVSTSRLIIAVWTRIAVCEGRTLPRIRLEPKINQIKIIGSFVWSFSLRSLPSPRSIECERETTKRLYNLIEEKEKEIKEKYETRVTRQMWVNGASRYWRCYRNSISLFNVVTSRCVRLMTAALTFMIVQSALTIECVPHFEPWIWWHFILVLVPPLALRHTFLTLFFRSITNEAPNQSSRISTMTTKTKTDDN